MNQGEQVEREVGEIAREMMREMSMRHVEMGRTSPPGNGPEFDPAQEPALDQVFALKRVNPHVPIAWPHWPKGIWPKAVAAMQKVVRRLLRWYIDPIVEQQNAYNAQIADLLALLHSQDQAQEEALADLRTRLRKSESTQTRQERRPESSGASSTSLTKE
ncbi:hypothetical protein ACFLT5_01325 [Chloroflexota bacterium]